MGCILKRLCPEGMSLVRLFPIASEGSHWREQERKREKGERGEMWRGREKKGARKGERKRKTEQWRGKEGGRGGKEGEKGRQDGRRQREGKG